MSAAAFPVVVKRAEVAVAGKLLASPVLLLHRLLRALPLASDVGGTSFSDESLPPPLLTSTMSRFGIDPVIDSPLLQDPYPVSLPFRICRLNPLQWRWLGVEQMTRHDLPSGWSGKEGCLVSQGGCRGLDGATVSVGSSLR